MFYRKNRQHSVYCAMVTVDSSVVAAGVLRVLGRNIAELPLAATDVDSQGQGYFRRLISGIKHVLKECRVHRFVLPATKEAEPMWVNKFGFTEMSEEQCKYYEENCWRICFISGTQLCFRK